MKRFWGKGQVDRRLYGWKTCKNAPIMRLAELEHVHWHGNIQRGILITKIIEDEVDRRLYGWKTCKNAPIVRLAELEHVHWHGNIQRGILITKIIEDEVRE
ncbi:hypothetical protein YC2023_078636 [Brassica napus]